MGTNYYLRTQPPCECCKRPFEELHIGKSSFGWCFALHVIPEMGLNDLIDWENLWNKPGASIVDEYGQTLTTKDMYEIITVRAHYSAKNDTFDYWRNNAEHGPNGLARSKIGPYCIGHGAGTWDLIPGEFS